MGINIITLSEAPGQSTAGYVKTRHSRVVYSAHVRCTPPSQSNKQVYNCPQHVSCNISRAVALHTFARRAGTRSKAFGGAVVREPGCFPRARAGGVVS